MTKATRGRVSRDTGRDTLIIAVTPMVTLNGLLPALACCSHRHPPRLDASRKHKSPSQIHYAERPVADYVRAAVEAAMAIHEEDLPGDILIFLTGALTFAA